MIFFATFGEDGSIAMDDALDGFCSTFEGDEVSLTAFERDEVGDSPAAADTAAAA